MNSENPAFTVSRTLASSRVAIAGLGLMGGSLAMALKGKCAGLLGVDPDPVTCALARQRNVVDKISENASRIFPLADLIILAAPVCTIITLLGELPDLHPGSAIVLDLGSTKKDIVTAMEILPERFDPIGGHPMCGKETSSLANADPAIFQNAPFALTPLARTTPQGQRIAEELVQSIGSHTVWLDPDTHDRWVAATSHLPYLLANALAAVTPLEARPLVGTGFRSTTRLAASSIRMMMDILETNRQPVLAALQRLRIQLERYEDLLVEGDFDTLEDLLNQGAGNQLYLTHGGTPKP